MKNTFEGRLVEQLCAGNNNNSARDFLLMAAKHFEEG